MVLTALSQTEHIAAFYIVWTMDLGAGVDRYGVLGCYFSARVTLRVAITYNADRTTHRLFWKHFDYQAETMQCIKMNGYVNNPMTQIN